MRLAIVGNGVAGVTTASTAAKTQPDSEIVIYSEESYLYYPRPKLWDFLCGKLSLDQLYFYPQEWYDQRNIRVRLGTKVSAIRPNAKLVVLADGATEPYDRLVLANGSTPFVPPMENVTAPGVFTLRNVQDALAIQEYARNAQRAIVIGGGLLGLESARGLKDLGLDVTVVEFFPWLLPRQLDEQGARVLASKFEKMGIHTITNAVTQSILGDQRAEGVALKDGRKLPGEIVIVSTGVRPNIVLAAEAGLQVQKGVIVDPYMQTTAPDVFAVGDAIEFDGRAYGIIPPAIEQARVAGANVIEPRSQTYKGTIPSNTLKVVGIDLTTVGQVNPPETDGCVQHRLADETRGVYKKLVVADNRLVGAILMGDPKSVSRISRMIKEGQPLTQPVDALLQDQ